MPLSSHGSSPFFSPLSDEKEQNTPAPPSLKPPKGTKKCKAHVLKCLKGTLSALEEETLTFFYRKSPGDKKRGLPSLEKKRRRPLSYQCR